MLLEERLPSEWAQLRKVAASGAGEHGRDRWKSEWMAKMQSDDLSVNQGTRRSPDGRQPRHD
jgi:hypothetical protein